MDINFIWIIACCFSALSTILASDSKVPRFLYIDVEDGYKKYSEKPPRLVGILESEKPLLSPDSTYFTVFENCKIKYNWYKRLPALLKRKEGFTSIVITKNTFRLFRNTPYGVRKPVYAQTNFVQSPVAIFTFPGLSAGSYSLYLDLTLNFVSDGFVPEGFFDMNSSAQEKIIKAFREKGQLIPETFSLWIPSNLYYCHFTISLDKNSYFAEDIINIRVHQISESKKVKKTTTIHLKMIKLPLYANDDPVVYGESGLNHSITLSKNATIDPSGFSISFKGLKGISGTHQIVAIQYGDSEDQFCMGYLSQGATNREHYYAVIGRSPPFHINATLPKESLGSFKPDQKMIPELLSKQPQHNETALTETFPLEFCTHATPVMDLNGMSSIYRGKSEGDDSLIQTPKLRNYAGSEIFVKTSQIDTKSMKKRSTVLLDKENRTNLFLQNPGYTETQRPADTVKKIYETSGDFKRGPVLLQTFVATKDGKKTRILDDVRVVENSGLYIANPYAGTIWYGCTMKNKLTISPPDDETWVHISIQIAIKNAILQEITDKDTYIECIGGVCTPFLPIGYAELDLTSKPLVVKRNRLVDLYARFEEISSPTLDSLNIYQLRVYVKRLESGSPVSKDALTPILISHPSAVFTIKTRTDTLTTRTPLMKKYSKHVLQHPSKSALVHPLPTIFRTNDKLETCTDNWQTLHPPEQICVTHAPIIAELTIEI